MAPLPDDAVSDMQRAAPVRRVAVDRPSAVWVTRQAEAVRLWHEPGRRMHVCVIAGGAGCQGIGPLAGMETQHEHPADA